MVGGMGIGAGLIALASTALAQASSALPSATSTGPPTIHTVNVAKGNFMYEPNATFAKPGDIVSFHFFPTNHSVVRAAYGLPCIPYEETGNNLTGFASPNFLTQDLTDPPVWNITINDTQPIFYYCTAIDSCQKEGMVGVINPNASVSLQAQLEKALQAPYMLTPGQPFPNEGEGGGRAPTPALTANPSLLNAPPTGVATAVVPSATAAPSGGSHLSGGAIAGIVVAAVAFLALLAGFFWLLGHRRGFGSATQGGSSQWGKSSKQDRTEAWAADSSTGPWGGTSDGGRGSEMYQKSQLDQKNNQGLYPPPRDGTTSPAPSNSNQYFSPMASPGMASPGMPSPGFQGHQSKPSEMHGISAEPAAPMELAGTEVTELEAPHAMKY